MPRKLVAVVVLVMVALSGCASLDSLVVADVPEDRLANGWSLDRERSEAGEVQAGPLTVAAFTSRVYDHGSQPKGAMAIVTVSDVAFADVEGQIRQQFREVLQEQGVERTERRSGQMPVDGFTADYTLYDARVTQSGVTVDGYVLEYTYGCSASGTVVGFLGLAATEIRSAVGSSSDASTWHEIAGSDWRSEFGGMSDQVRCRAG